MFDISCLMFYCFVGYVLLLFINMIGALAALCVNTRYGTTFGVSIAYLVIFTPCSFVCWYRPLYKAFRYARNLSWSCI